MEEMVKDEGLGDVIERVKELIAESDARIQQVAFKNTTEPVKVRVKTGTFMSRSPKEIDEPPGSAVR